MKKLLLVTVLAASFQSFAASAFEVSSNTVVYTEEVTSRADAYETGIDTLQQFKQLTGNQAYQKLNLVNDNTSRSSVKINDGRVFVDEFADSDGVIKYQAKVKLTYSYKESGNNK
jgi:hypothetical protein